MALRATKCDENRRQCGSMALSGEVGEVVIALEQSRP
jgi:hypothetical protein